MRRGRIVLVTLYRRDIRHDGGNRAASVEAVVARDHDVAHLHAAEAETLARLDEKLLVIDKVRTGADHLRQPLVVAIIFQDQSSVVGGGPVPNVVLADAGTRRRRARGQDGKSRHRANQSLHTLSSFEQSALRKLVYAQG